MRKHIKALTIISLSFLFSFQAEAQRKYDIYWVSFTDKQGTPFSIFRPQDYLSARALDRRSRYNILIDSTDLPINPKYKKAILDKGFSLHSSSNWLNGIAINVKSTNEKATDLVNLDFVKEVFPIGFHRKVQDAATEIGLRDYNPKYKKKAYYYGSGKNQINMLSGQYLHKMGFEGQEMHVAIMDGGFSGMRETPGFDSLFANGRILGTHDFVEGDDYVYESTTHGRNVASCMASNLPYLFVGTAPQAYYYFFKTEDVKGEYQIEEYNWVAAIERADKLGVDVVNSSLGYYDFDDNDMDYGYIDINGKTAAMTRAADLAAKKGMLIVTSAGNEGNDKWKHITVPGDADSVMTVGAVDRDGYHARFSSYGFENRDIIKPNLMARGAIAVVAKKKRYETTYSNGTSFSSPIMAGMVTSFWQAFPDYSNMEIIRVLQHHASHTDKPDNAFGYGVPNFFEAYKSLRNSVVELDAKAKYHVHLNGLQTDIDVFIKEVKASNVKTILYNSQGQVLWKAEENLVSKSDKSLWHASIPNWKDLPCGIYYLSIHLDDMNQKVLLAK